EEIDQMVFHLSSGRDTSWRTYFVFIGRIAQSHIGAFCNTVFGDSPLQSDHSISAGRCYGRRPLFLVKHTVPIEIDPPGHISVIQPTIRNLNLEDIPAFVSSVVRPPFMDCRPTILFIGGSGVDRKSTRLNSSHV